MNFDDFGTCNKCGSLTSQSKLEEFNGLCEDCYYNEKEDN